MKVRALTTALRICILVAVAGVASLSLAERPLVPSSPSSNFEALPMFSCAGKPLDLSRERLEQTALAEFERRGGRRLSAGEYEANLIRRGCDWWVAVLFLPAAPGNDFGVLIDGLDAKVKDYVRGH